MPIAVRVVSEQAFNEWVDAANKRPDWKTTGVERTAPTAVANVADAIVADANQSAAR
jgi:heme/copper-type cytochrome/quinol oxidase subunit 2